MTQIKKITNEKQGITTNTTEIQTILREYCEKIICQQIRGPRRNW